MNAVEDQTFHGEGSLREDLISPQIDNDQTSHVRSHFSNLSLTEANETIITDDGLSKPLSANPHERTADSTTPNIIYIIRTLTALHNFLTIHPPAFIRTIRLVPLYPLHSTLLTSEEQRGFYGPNITPLFAAWMNAFKLIPPTVQLIQVDISDSLVVRAVMLGRLAQHLSTTVWLRSEKKARFEIVGAKTDEGKAYIETGMVGLREGSAVIGGKEKFVAGVHSKN